MNDNPLVSKIFDTINQSFDRRITFAQYMDLCLYDRDYGYYNSEKTIIGNEGDFFTSASLCADFGELLAIQLYEFWQILGKKDNFDLVEMGAGNGNLALNILTYIINNYPDFSSVINYTIIEKSKTLQEKQQTLLKDISSHVKSLTWTNLDFILENSIEGCIFSNELIDAMPVHLIRYYDEKIEELYLTENNRQLTTIYDRISSPEITNYLKEIKINFQENNYPNNYQTEVNLQAINWLKQISGTLKKGYLLTIDYGYNADKYYHPQRQEGTLKCYYRHRHHNNPYINIGNQDITSHVNFTALEKFGEKFSLNSLAFTKQALFLMGLGLGDRLNQLSTTRISLTEILRKREQLHNLINPEGLGNFGVLLQSKNLSLSEISHSLTGFSHESII